MKKINLLFSILIISNIFTVCFIKFPLISISDENNDLLKLKDIQIRDPYILYFNNTYYMTGTTIGDGFLGYSSEDLMNWKYEGYIYKKNDSNYWAKYHFWAPEITFKNDMFFLWYTGKADASFRGTGVALSNNPLGPYVDINSRPLTPLEYDCLDGHLFTHPNGTEYFIYVYEWTQNSSVGIGEMWIQEIDHNYSSLIGEPIRLFSGGDAEWSNRVVDGPSMLYFNNTYYLFWSSFGDNGYTCGYAYSKNIYGPYIQEDRPVIDSDGGHSTWFRNGTINDEEGELLIIYHQPNSNFEFAHINKLQWNNQEERWVLDTYNPSRCINGYGTWAILLSCSISVVYIIILFRKKMQYPGFEN